MNTSILALTLGLAVVVLERVCGEAPSLNGVLNGAIYLQNLPSLVVSHVLGPQGRRSDLAFVFFSAASVSF